MDKDIQDFISIHRSKNGSVKIGHDASNEVNIYKLLNRFGFRHDMLNGKRIYFRRINGAIQLVNIEEIRDSFYHFLERDEFENLPFDIPKEIILDWFLRENPIRQNDLFRHHLKGSLSDFETHQLSMETDLEYKSEYETNQLLAKLSEWGFETTIDIIGSFCKGNDLYYKQIGSNEFLVLNHYNKNKVLECGFDAWKIKFIDKDKIGVELPRIIEQIRLSFKVERDYSLIEQYLK